jgi:hypothetical protein
VTEKEQFVSKYQHDFYLNFEHVEIRIGSDGNSRGGGGGGVISARVVNWFVVKSFSSE